MMSETIKKSEYELGLDDIEELLSDLLVVIMVLWLGKKCLYFLEMQSEIFGSGML